MKKSNIEYFIRKIRCIADYQFGAGVGEKLFPDNISLIFSRRTGKIRYIYLNEKLLATLRFPGGFFSLTIEGAKRLMSMECSKKMLVKVQEEVSSFIEEGRNVFAKHVKSASEEIIPGEEVIVVNTEGNILAVGKALLSGIEMKFFDRGVAVQVRSGVKKK